MEQKNHHIFVGAEDSCRQTDNELIRQYRDGNHDGFDVLLERYQAKVYGYIFSVVKDKTAADCIFQETFKIAIDAIRNDQYDCGNKFCPWIVNIAHGLIVGQSHNK